MCILAQEGTMRGHSVSLLNEIASDKHALIYSVNPESDENVPNAVIFVIDGTNVKFIDSTPFTNVADDLVRALKLPVGRSKVTRMLEDADELKSIDIVEAGNYTVVMARKATRDALWNALESVDKSKRPTLTTGMIDYLVHTHHTKVVCIACFNNAEKYQPLICTWKPNVEGVLRIPGGLDDHTGLGVDPNEQVWRNLYVLFASYRLPQVENRQQGIFDVQYSDQIFQTEVDPEVKQIFPAFVKGFKTVGETYNGDVSLGVKSLTRSIPLTSGQINWVTD